MDYTLAKELKDAGFLQDGNGDWIDFDGGTWRHNPHADFAHAYRPTLEELIEACNPEEGYFSLEFMQSNWVAQYGTQDEVDYYGGNEKSGGYYDTPTEAVARLWLALNKK